MLEPDEVMALQRLHRLGWGSKRSAAELGCARNTVRRYLRQGGWAACRSPRRRGGLPGLEDWLAERFRRHRGNCDVVRQELAAEKGIVTSLRTVQRALAPSRQELRAEARATVRCATPPGRRLRIDFGERLVEIGGRRVRVLLFVATLGHSRRIHGRAFRHERQGSWLDGLEGAFLAFGGVPEEVLFDNARALVTDHDATTRTVVFNPKLLAFARHGGFRPRACAPCRARTKDKTESGVGYVKRNAIAGRAFASWAALRPLADRPAFRACRTLERRVRNGCAVESDGNAYSVPWRLIGAQVGVIVAAGRVRVRHGTRDVAVHALAEGRRQRVVDPAHLAGVTGSPGRPVRAPIGPPKDPGPPPTPVLLRPLAEYEALVGGGF